MDFWWIFYAMYFSTSVRFFFHNGILAFPLPPRKKIEPTKLDKSDLILIQYPVRNEPREILERFFRSLESIPKEDRWRFRVQVLDDYDKKIPWRFKSSLKVSYLKRKNKAGGKAGNLNYGLRKANQKYKWVMVYDSDHVADGSRILSNIERMKSDEKLVCMQSRWIIQNKFGRPLSWLQDQFTHLHIDREQLFKSHYDLWPIFNGAGAIWKRDVLKETNGWMERTISEDIDLSGYLQFRGYKIEVDPEWITGIDAVNNWPEYTKQQKRWSKGNGQRLRYHLEDPAGWGFRKLYWISWNSGMVIAITKYIIPIIMILKAIGILPFFWYDWLGLIPHLFVLVASVQNWDNSFLIQYILLYPLHYFLEFRILHHQIKAFWEGFFGYKKEFEFEVTKKS